MSLRNTGEFAFRPGQLGIARHQSGVSAEQVVQADPDILAALDGPMFHHTGSRTCGSNQWDTCFRLLDKSKGLDEPTQMRGAGMTISVVGGRAVPKHGEAVAPGASVAVQLYPSLVWAGRNEASHEVVSSGAGVGILRDGRLLFLVGSGGTLSDLADAFIARGATHAGYTDGGSSTALYTRSTQGFVGVHAARPLVPTWLVVKKPTFAIGTKLPILLGAAALVALGVYLWRKARKKNAKKRPGGDVIIDVEWGWEKTHADLEALGFRYHAASRYSESEAIPLMVRQGHWGPWTANRRRRRASERGTSWKQSI